mmetsp:Transcript_21195/g.67098  ORF Transcript_21195/g.67098 Transcript_21195/m.67098 type:complete len:104 (+) Transcript_21195:1613-1924(+)
MASPLRMGGGLSGRDNLRRSAIKAGKPTSHTTTPSKLGKGKSLAAPSPRKALQVLSDNTKERPASTSKGPSAEKDPEQLVRQAPRSWDRARLLGLLTPPRARR